MLWLSERVPAGRRRTLEQSGGLSRRLRVSFLCSHPSQEGGNVHHSPSRWRNLGRARTPELLEGDFVGILKSLRFSAGNFI